MYSYYLQNLLWHRIQRKILVGIWLSVLQKSSAIVFLKSNFYENQEP